MVISDIQEMQGAALLAAEHARRCLMEAAPRYTGVFSDDEVEMWKANARLSILALQEGIARLEQIIQTYDEEAEKEAQKKG